MKDFFPWVRPESSQPSDSKEGEEEEMTGLLDRYAARKRKQQENVEQRAGLQLVVVWKCRRLLFRDCTRRDPTTVWV